MKKPINSLAKIAIIPLALAACDSGQLEEVVEKNVQKNKFELFCASHQSEDCTVENYLKHCKQATTHSECN